MLLEAVHNDLWIDFSHARNIYNIHESRIKGMFENTFDNWLAYLKQLGLIEEHDLVLRGTRKGDIFLSFAAKVGVTSDKPW
jgi:hypothetical protein